MGDKRATMRIENEEFSDFRSARKAYEDVFVRYCRFLSHADEGPHIDSTFVQCDFEGVDWYWVHFNQAVLVRCSFKNCQFRGATFSDALLVECNFENCQFLSDNLGGSCTNHDSRLHACTFAACTGDSFLTAP